MTFKHKLSARLALMKDALLVLALAALGCEKPVALTASTATIRLQIIPKSVTLPTDGATQLTAVAFTPAGDTANIHVNWTATGGSIADTSTNGGRHYAGYRATRDAGVFRVVASGLASSSDTATVTVIRTRVASVKVTPAIVSLLVGTAVQLTATTTDSAANVLSGRTISWSSSDAAVASVSASGLVTSVVPGSATITATSEGQSGTVAVTVTSASVASLQLAPTSANVFVGQTIQLTATPRDSANSPLTGRLVTWGTSNSGVATVSNSGLVAGVTQGSATITATSEGRNATAAITVMIMPVASVQVSPATASVTVGQTVQLSATPKDSAGGPLTGRPVTWTSSNTSIAPVNGNGLVTGGAAGSATITATSEGKSGTSVVTVQAPPPPPPSGSRADPTLLPVASGQVPNVVAYLGLNLPSRAAGFSYNDPVTGVKVWKVTSNTTPSGNSGAGHDYSDGPNEVSLGWGPNNNTHTILIGVPQGAANYYLVDFTRGAGFSNYRRLPVQPTRDLCFTFSNLASQPRIAYVVTGSQVVRFNTASMQVENTGNFPLNLGTFGWLHHDKNDRWFVGLTSDQTVAFAWNSQTNELRTHGEGWLNEARLERDGRYIALTNTNSTMRLWDLTTNTFGPTQSDGVNIWLGHNANLRGQWVTTDVNASAPFDLDRYYPSGGQIAKTRFLNNSAGPGVHHSGNWVQSDAELGNDLNKQWSFVSGVDNSAFTATALWKRGIGVVRSDGSDARLLVNHYSVNGSYWADPFAKSSPDGKVVIFNSDMNGSGRYDLFVAEVPLR
jgi:uncharacterized protein YjdB